MTTHATPALPITSANRLEARRYLTAQGMSYSALASADLATLTRYIERPETRPAPITSTPTPTPTTHDTMTTAPAQNPLLAQIAALIAAQPAPAPAAPTADTAALAADLAALADRIEDVHASAASVTSVTDAIRTAQTAQAAVETAARAASDARTLATDSKAIAARAEAMAADAMDAAKAAASASAPAAALVSRLDAIEAALSAAPPAAIARASVAASVASGTNPILARIAPLYAAGSDNGGTVACLISPPSFGKSHTVRQLGRSYDLFLEHGCSDDMDEISTLLGTVSPDGKGGFLTVDGILTQALRAAAAGSTVLLFLDEVFRLSPRAQEWLLTFLAPSKGAYTVRTRKALPDGTFETLSAPQDRLHIITAGNLGMMPPPEAFWSRLHKIRIAFDIGTLEAVAASVMAAYGIRDNAPATVPKLAAGFAAAMATSRQKVKEGALAYPVDIRLLERACRHAAAGDAAAVAEYAAQSMHDALTAWDGDLGDTLPQSAAAAAEIANNFRKATR